MMPARKRHFQIKPIALALAALAVAGVQALRTAVFGNMVQPRMRLSRYRWPETRLEPAPRLSFTMEQ